MRRSDLSLLKLPKFRRLFAARTISILGSAFTPIALAFGVLDLPGAGAPELALVLTVESLATLVTVLLGGVLGDRFRPTRILMLGESLAAISVGAMGFLFISGTATAPLLAVLGAFGGGAAGLLMPVLAGIVPETAPADRLKSANALLQLTSTSMQIGGSALAGILVAHIGSGWTLMIDAASFLLAVWIVAGIRTERRERTASRFLHELRVGWRGFISFTWIWATTLAATLWVGAFHAGFGLLGPVVAKSAYGGARGWSLVLAGFSIGGVLGTFVAARIHPRRPMVVVTALFQPGALFILLLALPATLPWMIVAAIGLGVSFSVLMVLWNTLLQVHVPPDLLARVASYDYLGSGAAMPLATAIVGSAVAGFGLRPTIVACTVVMVLAGLEPLLVRDVWRVGLEPDPERTPTPTSAPV
ncbi:MAG: MFS transporter [Actinomycetota bacterium]